MLISCPECQRLISEAAPACPRCGFTLSAEIVAEQIEKQWKSDQSLDQARAALTEKTIVGVLEDAAEPSKRIYEISRQDGSFRILGSEFASLLECWTTEKDRPVSH